MARVSRLSRLLSDSDFVTTLQGIGISLAIIAYQLRRENTITAIESTDRGSVRHSLVSIVKYIRSHVDWFPRPEQGVVVSIVLQTAELATAVLDDTNRPHDSRRIAALEVLVQCRAFVDMVVKQAIGATEDPAIKAELAVKLAAYRAKRGIA